MDIFTGISLFICVCIGVRLYCMGFFIFQKFEKLCELILFPFYGLQKLATKLCDRVPNFVQILLLVLISLGSGTFLIVSRFRFEDFGSYFTAIMDSTTLMSFINMWTAGGSFQENVNFPAMVAVAVSSFASFLYSQYTTHTVKNLTGSTPSHWMGLFSGIVTTLLNIIFFLMSALMAHFLTDWYASAADFLVAFFQQLESGDGLHFSSGFTEGLYTVYRVILCVLLLYAALASFTIVLQEYLATICYGIFSIAFIFLIGLLFANQINALPEMLGLAAVLLLLCAGDIVRSNEKVNGCYVQLVNYLGKRRKKKK